jgi:hypothetical protein
MSEPMSDERLVEIEARADTGCDGHGRAGMTLNDLPDVLFCPCTDQTAVDVRALLAEVRRLRRALSLSEASRGKPADVYRGEVMSASEYESLRRAGVGRD